MKIEKSAGLQKIEKSAFLQQASCAADPRCARVT